MPNSKAEIEVISAAANVPALTDEKIEVVKQTVAKGATDAELAMFLAVAQKYDLDPFAKEIFFIKDKDKPDEPGRVQTGRDGFLAIANRHPAYQGMTSDVVFLGDSYTRTKDGVDHGIDFAARKATIVGAYALVYRSDRSIPSYAFARFAEYAPANPSGWSPWKKFPSAMILKVAETAALKKAFSISGMSAIGISEPDDGEPEPPRPAERPMLTPTGGYTPPRTVPLHDEASGESRPASSMPTEGAAHPSHAAVGSATSEAPGGAELFPPSQDELDALAEDAAEHRDPTDDDTPS